MRDWVRTTKGRLVYAGRVTRAPFQRWTGTSQGKAAVRAAAAGIRFALLGRERTARQRLWRTLADAARDHEVIDAVQAETDTYLARAGQLAYSNGLPRSGVELHRLVVVPRVLLNNATYRGLHARLASHAAFEGVEAGAALREFFVLRFIFELHAAIVRSAPSPERAIAAGRTWMTVGVNSTYVWRVPVNAPTWNGHHYVIELTRDPITRRVRKAMAERIAGLERSLESLSVERRSEILRQAMNPS